MKYIIGIVLALLCSTLRSQNLDEGQELYNNAFMELRGMLNDSIPLSFKRATFISENAFVDNKQNYEDFNDRIRWLAKRATLIAAQGDLQYAESDKDQVEKYGAVFRLMTDTVRFFVDSTNFYETKPLTYDFDDFLGEMDWKKMFVTKLLATGTGNCHSLPFLYKILCEEMNETAYLAMAPSHIYIKLRCKKLGWYNTELTSGRFPIDAWIMASGYVPLSAVQSRVYMDTLSAKQSVAVCLVDLAKGYERKFRDNANPEFIIKCTNVALQYYPQYLNALILKAETFKRIFQSEMVKKKAEYPSDLFKDVKAKILFDDMQSLYAHIHDLGYRKMPSQMYLAWLSDLKREKTKYTNREIQNLNEPRK
jgi:hypothetical protein